MNKPDSKSKQKKVAQTQATQKKKQEQTRQTILLISVIAAVVLITVGVIWLTNRTIYDRAPKSSYTVSETATNYVKLNVSYTDNDGKKHNGDIIVKLDPEAAPITVANFQKLVGEGFYDNLTFHRIIKNFMIQGGDPLGNGTGGSDQDITGEFSANGIDNPIKHERGVISMARNGEHYNENGEFDYGYNTASSQFFIMHKTTESLDGQYAAFGHVVFGMTTVDGIASVKTNSSDKPTRTVRIESAVFVNYTE